jgi:hypothetical protein
MENLNFELTLIGEDAEKQVINFKNFLEKQSIEDLDELLVKRTEHQEGQMGVGGILGSVSGVIRAASQPLTELVKCLQKYIQSFNTEIEIKISEGEKTKYVKLSGKDPKKVEDLVKLILADNSNLS